MSSVVNLIPDDYISREDLIELFENGPLKGKKFTLNDFPYTYEDGWFKPDKNADYPSTFNLNQKPYLGLLAVRYLDDGANISKTENTVTLYASESVHSKPVIIKYND